MRFLCCPGRRYDLREEPKLIVLISGPCIQENDLENVFSWDLFDRHPSTRDTVDAHRPINENNVIAILLFGESASNRNVPVDLLTLLFLQISQMLAGVVKGLESHEVHNF